MIEGSILVNQCKCPCDCDGEEYHQREPGCHGNWEKWTDCEFHGPQKGNACPKCESLPFNGLTKIEQGRVTYQAYLRATDKMKFIVGLSTDEFASMQMYIKIKEDINETTL